MKRVFITFIAIIMMLTGVTLGQADIRGRFGRGLTPRTINSGITTDNGEIYVDFKNQPALLDITHTCPKINRNPVGVTSSAVFFAAGPVVYRHNGYRGITSADMQALMDAGTTWNGHYLSEDNAGNIFYSTRDTSNGNYLLRSTDGGDNFAKVLGPATTPSLEPNPGGHLPRSFVDLGGANRLFIDYSTYSLDLVIYKSADNGATWADVMRITGAAQGTAPIRHFHGGVYDSETSILYIFTGDDRSDVNGTYEPSILVCNDVADFLLGEGSWATDWKTKWGLDDVDRTGLDPAYVLNDDLNGSNQPTSQKFRTVDFYIEDHPTTGVKYGYWAADQGTTTSGGGGGKRAYRYDLDAFASTGAKNVTDLGEFDGEGWEIAVSGDYILIGSSRSDAATNESKLYAINKDRDGIVEVASYNRFDTSVAISSPVGPSPWANGLIINHVNVGVSNSYEPFWSCVRLTSLDKLGRVWSDSTLDSDYDFNGPNLIPNPMLNNAATGLFDTDSTARATVSQVTAADLEPGRAYSLKIQPDAGVIVGSSRMVYAFDETIYRSLSGSTLTFSCMWKLPNAVAGQRAYFLFQTLNEGVANNQTQTIENVDLDDDWHELRLTITLFPESTYLWFMAYAHLYDGDITDGAPLFISSPRLVRGSLPGGEGIPALRD